MSATSISRTRTIDSGPECNPAQKLPAFGKTTRYEFKNDVISSTGVAASARIWTPE